MLIASIFNENETLNGFEQVLAPPQRKTDLKGDTYIRLPPLESVLSCHFNENDTTVQIRLSRGGGNRIYVSPFSWALFPVAVGRYSARARQAVETLSFNDLVNVSPPFF